MKRPSKAAKKGWYPVTTLGYGVTLGYFLLLLYVVFKINADLYSTNISLFYGSLVISGIIVLILLWARWRGEKIFYKK